MFLKEWILIEQAIHMNVGFVITGTFFKKNLDALVCNGYHYILYKYMFFNDVVIITV